MYFEDVNDRWWHSDEISKMPGQVVPFFGAGLSIDLPTDLPDGLSLTKDLILHLLDRSVADRLLEIFSKHAHVLGRKVPRLEHLLSVATRTDAKAAKLLDIFREPPPNRNHHILAQHITRRHSWALTTNFDECVEQASKFLIPVHVFDPQEERVRVLHGPQDADWGMIKLHGTIGDGAEKLAVTIERLTPGLAPQVRQLLDRVFSSADFVVVAGYSGSDHFDINRYLQSKLGTRFRADIIWLQHGTGPSSRELPPEIRGPYSFQRAFSGARSHQGDTSELLGKLLGCDTSVTPAVPKARRWSELLSDLYTPTAVDRHRMGAVLGSTIGLNDLTGISIPKLRYELENDDEGLLEEAASLALDGYGKLARDILRRHKKVNGESTTLLIASNLRRSGKPLRALLQLAFYSYKLDSPPTARADQLSAQLEKMKCVLDVWRFVRRTRIGRTKAAGFVFKELVNARRRAIERAGFGSRKKEEIGWTMTAFSSLNAEAEIDWQLIHLRTLAYGEYYNNGHPGQWQLSHMIWEVIADEMAEPDIYIDNRPLFPGFYLDPAVTNSELDRVADLFEVRLAYIDILVACVQNFYLDNHKMFRELRNHILGDGAHVIWKLYDTVRMQFQKALEAAVMLGNDETYSRLAKSWLSADRALFGLKTWEEPKIYMASLKKSERLELDAYNKGGPMPQFLRNADRERCYTDKKPSGRPRS